MAGLDTKKRFTVPHTYAKCMWDGKPFLQVPHNGRDGWRTAPVCRVTSEELFGAGVDAEKKQVMADTKQEFRSQPCHRMPQSSTGPRKSIKISSPEPARFSRGRTWWKKSDRVSLRIMQQRACHTDKPSLRGPWWA